MKVLKSLILIFCTCIYQGGSDSHPQDEILRKIKLENLRLTWFRLLYVCQAYRL
jgi:hypothetical protein